MHSNISELYEASYIPVCCTYNISALKVEGLGFCPKTESRQMKSGFVITCGLLVCVGVIVSAEPPPPPIFGLFLCFGAPSRFGWRADVFSPASDRAQLMSACALMQKWTL